MSAVDELIEFLENVKNSLESRRENVPDSLLTFLAYCNNHIKKDKFKLSYFDAYFRRCRTELFILSSEGYIWFNSNKDRELEKFDELVKRIRENPKERKSDKHRILRSIINLLKIGKSNTKIFFEVTLDLGELREPGEERKRPKFRKQRELIKRVLANKGLLDPRNYLLRGGFRNVEDLNLLKEQGTDLHGRTSESIMFSKFNEICLGRIDDIGTIGDVYLDPLFHSVREDYQVHILVIYDSSNFELINAGKSLYRVIDPKKISESLLGIIYLRYKGRLGNF